MNQQERGIFIVIEGTDGSGKGTQFKLLAERLKSQGYDVATFDFPRYDEPSSYFVKKYLNGDYGNVNQVGPYTGSLFYALDRYDAAPAIRQALEAGKIVLANRYTASNMGHQGTKFDKPEERRGYFIWLDNLEFEMLKIPRPDLNIVLRVPAEIAQKLVDLKTERQYTDKKRDIHEADLEHLKRAVEVYDDLTKLFPRDFTRIDCVRDKSMMSIEAIQKLVYEKISPLLPDAPASKPSQAAAGSDSVGSDDHANPYVNKTAAGVEITGKGRQYLEQAVSNATGQVYTFSDKLSPVTIAAAMARLSRRGDDMRLTILDEFAHALEKDGHEDEQLLHRVITAYGDDSVQQLVSIPIAVEDASQLLVKKLEWGRLAAYLEQSTRYIYYDKKDAAGNYRYVVPGNLDNASRRAYVQHMDDIFDRYSEMVHKLTDYVREHSSTPQAERDGAWKSATRAQACDAARAVLPAATKSTVGIYASGQAIESLIMHLLADDLPEARATGQLILQEARKVIPAFLERADKPDRGGARVAYMANTAHAVKKLANDKLPATHVASRDEAVSLTDVWPRNELDLVADMLYEHSDLPLKDLRAIVESWSYEQKAEVIKTYIGERLNRRHKPGRALEKAHYSWDLVCDYGIFRDLQRHRMVDDLEWQELTPRHGYEVPKLVEEAGLTDMFEDCFDISLRLYSLLQQNGYELEAQYAVLLGHKLRWKVTYNAREAFHLHELRTSPQGHPGYRKLVGHMHAKLAEAHPLLAEAMRFVNQDEDAELTRLAAERYTQFKLRNSSMTDNHLERYTNPWPLPVDPGPIREARQLAGQLGVASAIGRLFERAGIEVRVDGDDSLWSQTGQGALFVGDHHHGLESIALVAALGQRQREDWHFVGKPFALQARVAGALGAAAASHLLPVIPSRLARDRRPRPDRNLLWRVALGHRQLPTYDQVQTINTATLDKCAAAISHGSLVTLFPTGGIMDATKRPWRNGVGKVIKRLPPDVQAQTTIVPFQAKRFPGIRLVRSLLMSHYGHRPQPLTASLTLGRQGSITELLGDTERDTPEEITQKLRQQYLAAFVTNSVAP